MSSGRLRLLVPIALGIAFPALAASAAGPRPDNKPPSAPSGLAATIVSSDGATIAWTKSKDNVGVAGYYVYVNGQRYTTIGP